jgi:hypothetical protein
MDDLDSEWQRKGATLSHKTAQEEFGLKREEIVRAIRAGKLRYREHADVIVDQVRHGKELARTTH